MKWHSFKFDYHLIDTFIVKSIATGRKYLDIELDGEFIGQLAYDGFDIPLQSEVELYVEEYFSEMALGVEP